jgi:hypothetical protein
VSGVASTPAGAERILNSRFRAGTAIPGIAESLRRLRCHGLLENQDSRLTATAIGRLVSLKGLSTESGRRLRDFLEVYTAVDHLSWLYRMLGSPETGDLVSSLWLRDGESERYFARLSEYSESDLRLSPELRSLLESRQQRTLWDQIRLKGAFLLNDWCGESTTADLEEQYHINLGTILQLGGTVSWLLDTGAAIAGALGKPAFVVAELRRLATAVARGFDLPDTVLSRLPLAVEQRDQVWSLWRRGFVTATDFNAARRDELAAVIGPEQADQTIAMLSASEGGVSGKIEEEKKMTSLLIPGIERGSRVLIHYGDREIDISPKSFNYLFKLAIERLRSPEGWLDKEEIEPGFNQAKNIYRVKQELKRFKTGLEQCIENNKGGRYRINLDPSRIRVDCQSMLNFPDLELVELTRRMQVAEISAVN